MRRVVLQVGMNDDVDFIIRDPKVYIIYIIRLYMSDKALAKGVIGIVDVLLPPPEV